MEGTAKAIETVFMGFKFRSRLEARWAVFLDKLSVHFQYEVEGYNLGAKQVWYLPDFYIPAWDKHVEIKPATQLSRDEIEKAGLLVQYTGKPLLIIQGDPWPGEYRLLLIVPTSEPGTIAPHKACFDKSRFVFGAAPASKQVYLYRVADDDKPRDEESVQNFIPLTHELIVMDGAMAMLFKPDQHSTYADDVRDGIHTILGHMNSVKQLMECNTPLSRAFIAARQARFEHGESG